MSRSLEQAWKDFPALTQKFQGRGFSYLDSAATTLKPWPVIERVSRFLSFETANVHRGSYRLSDKATQAFEETRQRVQNFLGAEHESEIVFTKGSTDSINLIAQSLSEFYIQQGDAVIVSEWEHHSNWVPWQRVCEKVGGHFLVLKVTPSGAFDWDQLSYYLKNYAVKIVAVTALSNALGLTTDLKTLKEKLKISPQTKFLVDGAQGVTFLSLNVQELQCDFLVFSGHKIFGPYGVGVAYIKKEMGSQMPPYQSGGAMVDRVTGDRTTYLDSPFRFEAGTPNIEGVIGLGAALEYFQQWDHKSIQSYESSLYQYLVEEIKKEISSVVFFGLEDSLWKAPLLSFQLKGCHSLDVAQLLNEENVFVRSGHHCCQPLMASLGVSGTVRASLSLYSRAEDIQRLVRALKKTETLLL
jgi:cysteine desulfurase / selenocysteine lyase